MNENERTLTYITETMGCQMNKRDSETIAGFLTELGYEKVSKKEDANVVVINTCSVRDNADQRFFGVLGQLKNIKRKKPETVVAVCGCMMQQQHIVDKIKKTYPWVDIVFGTHNVHMFPQLLQNLIEEKKKTIDIWEAGGEIIEGLPAAREYPFKAFVNIMQGCNNFCTYCIVPYTRGRERSRKPEEIILEVENLGKNGVKEITLLGQNVNSYEGDFASNIADFPDLIHRLNQIDGIERIRFLTSHPKDISKKLIETFRDCHKLCKSIHLPVQSGSTEILKRMNRKYSKEDYLNSIENIRKICPDITISTDIIIGFPGETEEDFMETMDLIEKVQFDAAFTFLYSVRKGTPAEAYQDQVPEEEKHRRFNVLVNRLNHITREKNKKFIGIVERVLVEGASKNRKDLLTGKTDGGKVVNFQGSDEVIGKMINVKIIGGRASSLQGEVVEEESFLI